MRATITAVWPVIVCTVFVQAGNGLQTDLIGLRAEGVFAPVIIGLMMAAYYAGYCVAPLVSRTLVGRFGQTKCVVACMALAAGVIIVQPLVVSAPAWIGLRVVSGFALSLSYVAIESWVNGSVPNLLRGRIFSTYMLMQVFGMTLAQGLLNIGDFRQIGPFFLTAGLFALAAMVIVKARQTAPAGVPPRPLGIGDLFRLSPFGASATVFSGLAWAILFTFGPVYARRIGLDVSGVALFMGCAMAAGGALQLPVGWLSDVMGRRAVIVLLYGGGLLASLCGLLFPDRTMSFAAVAMAGACIFPIYTVSAAHVNDRVLQDARVAAAASLVLLFGLGSLLGPLLCGWLIDAVGQEGFFGLLTATMAAGTTSALWLFRQQGKEPARNDTAAAC